MTTTTTTSEPAWVARFLEALRAGHGANDAAAIAGTGITNARSRRRRSSDFARAWTECEAVKRTPAGRISTPEGLGSPRGLARLDRFIDELAATSNVSAAAAVANIAPSTIYKQRRSDPQFARRWYAALAEGYDNLEMELLGRLRAGDGGGEAAQDKRKFDTATALRCLTAHRESVAREKGRRTLAQEVTTIASINAKIDALRLREKENQRAIRKARRDTAKRRLANG